MSRSTTTGIYTRVDNSFSNPVVGTTINPTDADSYFDDIDGAMNAFIGTSTTSLAVGTGSKSFTTQTAKAFLVGAFVQAFSQADHANYMYGTVTSYNAGTGALVLNVTATGGSGTLADWLLFTAGAQGAAGAAGAAGGVVEQQAPGGRITLTSGTPVMATSVTAATTVYYAPMVGKYVPINTAGTMGMHAFTASDNDAVGLSIVLGASWAANSNYDVFVALDGATVRLATGPDWSAGAVPGANTVGASTRGTGAGSTQLQIFKGFLTNQNSMTCRYANGSTFAAAVNEATYLGTFRTGSAGQVSFTYGASGTAGTFNLWNAFNQQQFCSTGSDSTASWVYGVATPRQARASSVNQFNWVCGLAGGSIDASYNVLPRTDSVIGAAANVGIALNSTSTVDKQTQLINPAAQIFNSSLCAGMTYGGKLGANYIAAIEYGDGVNGVTWFGQNYMALRVSLWM